MVCTREATGVRAEAYLVTLGVYICQVRHFVQLHASDTKWQETQAYKLLKNKLKISM
jgi:hypothetical protein